LDIVLRKGYRNSGMCAARGDGGQESRQKVRHKVMQKVRQLTHSWANDRVLDIVLRKGYRNSGTCAAGGGGEQESRQNSAASADIQLVI
jgi:hypothetical protein